MSSMRYLKLESFHINCWCSYCWTPIWKETPNIYVSITTVQLPLLLPLIIICQEALYIVHITSMNPLVWYIIWIIIIPTFTVQETWESVRKNKSLKVTKAKLELRSVWSKCVFFTVPHCPQQHSVPASIQGILILWTSLFHFKQLLLLGKSFLW